jgi:plasmid stabilization system protein ParE
MPRGDKDKYTDKQKRKAEHIAEGYEESGVSEEEAKSRAWATVNKESGGGNKSGSGRGVEDTTESSERGGRIAGRKRAKARGATSGRAGTKRAKTKRAGTKRTSTKRAGTKRSRTKRTSSSRTRRR